MIEQTQFNKLLFENFMENISREQLKAEIDRLDSAYLSMAYQLIRQLLDQQVQDTTPTSLIFSCFEEAGLVGCLETDDQLFTTYKERLNFTLKHGESPFTNLLPE